MRMIFHLAFASLLVILCMNSLSAQIVGGREPGEMTPRAMEAEPLNGDQFMGNVNLFNGSYQGSYSLGSVSTPGGLNFNLQMTYSSNVSGGGNVSISSGIPYGEGWDLSLPYIKVESDPYRKYNQSVIDGFLSSTNAKNEVLALDDREGDLYWHSVFVNIPGKLNCRAVFKYTDTLGQKIFVPHYFDKYAEIILSGDKWKVTLDDGTVYLFSDVLESVSTASNERGAFDYSTTDVEFEVGNDLENQITPKVSILKWLCSTIKNPNIPNQSISFYYEKFGKFDFFQEFQQRGIKNKFHTLFGSSEEFSTYKDILLTKVQTEDPFSSGDQLILEYKTKGISAPGNRLKIHQDGVKRYDSLYNYKTVYLRGVYNSGDYVSQNNHQSGFVNWNRYYHAAHDILNPASIGISGSGDVALVNPTNPYLRYDDIASKFFYNRKLISSGSSGINFDHCYLESDRLTLDEQWVSGDIYEIKSSVSSSNGVPLNIDINIATGPNTTIPTSPGPGGSQKIDPLNYNSSLNKFAPAKESIFSTFSSATKWNTRGETDLQPSNSIETSNFFSMPNLPNDYDGFHIQIGPANSDNIYNANTSVATSAQGNSSIKSAFNTYHQQIPGTYDVLQMPYYKRIAANFGLGMPWYMMRTIYKGLGSNSIDETAYDYDFWMNLTDGITYSWNNEPTLTEVATLNKVELIRYSKNPYMLNSVKNYVASGEFDGSSLNGKTLTSQFDLNYKVVSHNIIDNKAYTANNILQDNPDRYQHVYLLETIENVPTNPSGTALTVNTNLTPTTHFSYSAQRQSQFDESQFHAANIYLLTGSVNSLGKEIAINYHDVNSDTITTGKLYSLTNHEQSIRNQSSGSQSRGVDEATQIVLKVDYVKEKIGNTDFRIQNYEYSKDFNAFTPRNYLTVSNGFDERGGNSANIGYQEVKLTEPEINGKRNYTIYTYYDKNALVGINKFYGGELAKIEKFNADNTLSQKQEFQYEVVKAYEGAYDRPANKHELFAFDYIDYFLEERPTDLNEAAFFANYYDFNFDDLPGDRYQSFKFYESHFKSNLGSGDLSSFFIKKTQEKTTIYDQNFCNLSGTVVSNPNGNNLANGETYAPTILNNATLSNASELADIFANAESYEDILGYISEFSPLSDDLILILLMNTNLYTELGVHEEATSLDPYMRDFIMYQNPLSDSILTFLLSNQAMSSANIFGSYVSLYGPDLSENMYSTMIGYSDAVISSQLQTLLSGHPSHTNEILIQMLLHNPSFSEALLEAVLLSQIALSDTVLITMFQNIEQLSGQRIENILLNQATYPSETVLLQLVNLWSTLFPDNVMNVLKAAETALPLSVFNALNGFAEQFDPEDLAQLQYLQLNAPSSIIACSSTPLNQAVTIQNITDYEYYDANYNGVSYSKGYLDLFGSNRDSAYLKYEPSWQLYSSKTYSPEYPDAYQELRNYYYYDLKNRYNRYDIEYPSSITWEDGLVEPLSFDETDSLYFEDANGIPHGVLDPNFIDIDVFSNYSTNTELSKINPQGLDRSMRHRLRNIPYQQMTVSQNGAAGVPIKKSKYFIYGSDWGNVTAPFSTIRNFRTDTPDPCATSGGGSTTISCSEYTPYKLSNVIKTRINATTWDVAYLSLPSNSFIIKVTYLNQLNYDLFTQHISCIKSSYGADTSVIYDPRIPPDVSQPDPNQIGVVWGLSQAMLLQAVIEQVDTVLNNEDNHFNSGNGTSNLFYGNKDLLHFMSVGDLVDPNNPNLTYTENIYRPIVPYEHIYDQKVLERNVHTLPKLIEDRIGIKTRFIYDPMETVKRYDTICNIHLSTHFDVGNRHRPTKVVTASGRADSTITEYEYYPDLSIKSIEELDHNIKKSFRYDAYGRIREERRDGELINKYTYGFWNSDQSKTFDERAKDNYLESIHFPNDSGETALISRQYSDPLGRTLQTVTGELEFGLNSTHILASEHTGRTVYDNRDRVLQQYKPFAYDDGVTPFSIETKTSSNNPLYPDVAASFAYEDNWLGRLTASAKPGEDIPTGRKVTSSYELMNSYCFACELGLSNLEISLLMPHGVSGNYVFSKQSTIDEDNKQSDVYTNASGQTVATRQFDGTESVVTLSAYDKTGNLTTVINPNNQRSNYKYNLMNWMYQQETPDGGVTKYRYTKLGQVALKQDEKARAGRTFNPNDGNNPEGNYSYVTLYNYDDYGNLISEGEVYNQRNDGFLGNSGAEVTLGDWIIYPFTNNSTYSWTVKGHYASASTSGTGDGGWAWFSNGQNYYGIDPICWPDPCPVPPKPDIIPIDPLRSMSQHFLSTFMEYSHGPSLGALNLDLDFENKINARNNLTKRLNYVYRYNDLLKLDGVLTNDERLVEATFYDYTKYGEVDGLIKQFNPNGLAAKTTPEFKSQQEYSEFNNDGIWKQNNVDILADDVLDMQFYNEIDARGRITESYANYADEKTNGNKIVSFQYDNVFGRVTSKETYYTKGSVHHATNLINYTYDVRDRLTASNGDWLNYEMFYDGVQANHAAPTPLGNLNYNGNINGIKSTFNLTAASNYSTGNLFDNPTVYNYSYDGLNRLTKADASVGDFLVGTDPTHNSHLMGDANYTYDQIGNLKQLQRYIDDEGTQQHWDYSYDAINNKLNTVDGLNGTSSRTYTYDVAGNLQSDDSRGIREVEYADGNLPLRMHMWELVRKENEPGYIDYMYDAEGNRIYKLSEDVEANVPLQQEVAEYYLRDIQGKSIAVCQVTGSLWEYYVYANSREAKIQPWYTLQPGYSSTAHASGTNHFQINQYTNDHLGNTKVVYQSEWDASQNEVKKTVLGAYDYFPYGKILRSFQGGSGHERYLTTQHERDQETISENNAGTGLDNRGARFYDSDVARFLSVDPLAAKYVSWSPYNYVLGNPIRYIDPDGREVVVPNKSDRAPILKMINSRALGLFAFDKSGKLYQVRATGDATKYSSYYRDRLVSAINDPDKVSISIGTTYTEYPSKLTKNTDKDGGGGITNKFTTTTTDPVTGVKTVTKTAEVVISGNENKNLKDTKGNALRDKGADILNHELVGHAIPFTVGGDTGNAVDNENKTRKQLGKGKNQQRKAEPTHNE